MGEAIPRWPRRIPATTLVSFLFALAIGPAMVYFQARHWTSLQRFYFADYLRSALPGMGKTGKYRLLHMQTSTKSLFALDDWIVPQELPKEHPKDAIPFVLSVEGQQHDGIYLHWETLDKADSQALHSFLEHWVYDNHTLADLVRRPSLCAAFAALFFVPFGAAADIRRRREIRKGRQIRGPELVSRARFNKIMQSKGVGFQTNEPLDIYEMFKDRSRQVRLREADEFSHFLIIGDSGSGKSSLIRQMLTQIQLRKQPAIVYDPDCQFIRHFYREERGDWVLNPIDRRCPYWHPGDEINYAADTVAVASSLYSRDLKEPPFFMDSARDLMAELLKWNPSAADLATWMAHPEEIDRRIKGTPLESVITHNAQGQRMGVLGTFNKISAALNLLPTKEDALRRWSANAWAKERDGWIFVTSTPEAREALRPLHSLWLDTLILRLLGTGQDSEHGVWIVLDELASLQKLPQLHTAITEGRKSKNRIIIGIQGSAQLETLYGPVAVTMLSQPSTKILLRTSEPRAAKWMSDTIGEVEIERFRESRQASYGFGGGKSTKTYSQDRKTEPLVSAAQISGLPNMEGYLKSGNYVVPIQFPYLALPLTSHPLIRRNVNRIQFRETTELPPIPQKGKEKTDAPEPRRSAESPDSAPVITPLTTPATTPAEVKTEPQPLESEPQNEAPAPTLIPVTSNGKPAEPASRALPQSTKKPAAAGRVVGSISRPASSDIARQEPAPGEQAQLELAEVERAPDATSRSEPRTVDEKKRKEEDQEHQLEEARREQQRVEQQQNQQQQSFAQQP